MRTLDGLDPTTFEILANRLRSINDSQGALGRRISGSSIVYECGDYNCSIMDAAGNTLYLGHYNMMLGAAMDLGVKWILANLADVPGIRPGDVFFHNDPWVGTLHPPDCVALAPIFIDDELIAWLGMAMHEADVGGMVPGSFAVGARERFAEATIISPVKIVDGGVLRPDVERAILRNSRMPESMALNLRARIGAFNFARAAIDQVVKQYGRDALLATMRGIQGLVTEGVGTRLDRISNGRWRRVMYIDGDGVTPDAYRAELTLTKIDRHLAFDFTGTGTQAVGGINTTICGLHGALNVALLCSIGYDLPWATSAFREFTSVTIEPETIFSAVAPAPVSGGSVASGSLCTTLVQSVIAEMLLESAELRGEAMAVWQPFWNGIVLSGTGHGGDRFTGLLLDGMLGGEGATPLRDGQDVGGRYSAISLEAANVERNERVFPILELARVINPESCGHGEHRGGAGAGIMFTPHKTNGSLQDIVYSAYNEQPTTGLAGGLSAACQGNRVARRSDIWERIESGSVPVSLAELTYQSSETCASKSVTELCIGDVHWMDVAGGAGFGDPLRRAIVAVERDLELGRYSPTTAYRVYGCVVDRAGRIDEDATARRRDGIRKERLDEADPVVGILTGPVGSDAISGEARRCMGCDYSFGTGDPRLRSVSRRRSTRDLSPLNYKSSVDNYVIWEFCCPSCGTLIAADGLDVDSPVDVLFLSSRSPNAAGP